MKVTVPSLVAAGLLFSVGVAAFAGIKPQSPAATVDAGLLARVVVTAPALSN